MLCLFYGKIRLLHFVLLIYRMIGAEVKAKVKVEAKARLILNLNLNLNLFGKQTKSFLFRNILR
jgi:hypothetical protein